MQYTLSEIVIRTTYEKTCSLLEYVKSNATASNFVEPCGELLSFMTSSIVACGPETRMFCPGTITLEKESSIEELVEQLTTINGRIGQTNKNVLTLGYRLNACPGPPEFICEYPNSMVSHVNSPLFKELHGLIGSALFYYLLRHLSLFVSKGSCFMQVTGHPINDVCLKATLQSQPGGKKGTLNGCKVVSHHNIFNAVGGDKTRCFPKQHIMERTKLSISGARSIICGIFLGKHKKRLPKHLTSAIGAFKRFLQRHKSCPFKVLLDKFCPTDDGNYKETGVIKDVPHFKVKLFCLSVCKRAVPKELWGTRNNMNAFVSSLTRFISLRKKENMALKEIMDGIKINDCDFLKFPDRGSGKKHNCDIKNKRTLVSKFFYWLMNSYFVTLLRNAFTISESLPRRNYMSYYRKQVFADVHALTVRDLEESMITPLPREEAERLITSGESLGCAPLRLIPKTSGVRPVMNMAACQKNPSANGPPAQPWNARSVNQKLTKAHCVLSLERQRSPELIGGGVFNFGEVFSKIKGFAEKHRDDRRPLYFVRMDITKCYDSMKQDKMLEIVREAFAEDEYNIRKYATVKKDVNDNINVKHLQSAVPLEDCRCFPAFVDDEISNNKLRNVVLVDKVKYDVVERDELLEDLEKHVKCNLIKVSNNYYIQKCGVAQGSKISPLLCHLYLGHFERAKFANMLSDPDSLLMRWIDDPILLSYNLDVAKYYLTTMLRGDPDYNCHVNIEKCLTNFPAVTPSGVKIKKLAVDESWIPWCSVLVNKNSLEVKCDYSRTEDSRAMRDTLTFDLTKTPRKRMLQCLKVAMLPKCHKLFLDLTLNSRETVKINLDESFQYFARRFHAFASELPSGIHVKDDPQFFLNGLNDIIETYYSLAKKFLKQAISREAVFSSFYGAVLDLVRKRRSTYGNLKVLLEDKLRNLRCRTNT